MIWGSGGSKSRLAKAAGAEPSGEMRDEKLHAVVARSTFPSQNVQKHLSAGPLLEVAMSKTCTPLWREAHFEVKMYKTHLYHQVTAQDVEVCGCWTWGAGRDGRRHLHVAYGKVEVQDSWQTVSLVVVPSSGGEVQPFGIVVLDPAIWHLARIERQLWCVDGQEFGFYCAVANRGVEDRGTPLDTGITAGSAGLTLAAGANSYFHAPRSERVPDRHQWIAGSLRPRTWMPTASLNLLAEYSRPKLYSKLLLDMALWRAATIEHGISQALAPAYTTSGSVEDRSAWQSDVWIWALSQVIQSVDTQLKTCTERVVFEVQPVRATTHSSRATVVDLHGDGTETVAGFFVREEDLHQWLAAPAFAVSRAVDLEADISATETENPDGKVAVIDWLQPGDGSKIQCTTLHIITFDGRTRFAKVRNPVRVRAGYRLRVRLGDWAGHSPAYLSIVNAGFKDPRAEAAGVPPSNTCLWDFFELVGAKLQAALGCACEVVVASPGVRKTSLVLCQRVQALTLRATKQQTQHTSILRDAPRRTRPTTSTSTAQQPLRQRERKQEQPEAQQEHQQEQDWQIAASRSHLLKW